MKALNKLLDAARQILRDGAYAELRELQVELTAQRRLVLRGAVHSFYHKQLAQEMLRSLAIEHDCSIVNKLDVMDVLSV